jgi:transcriptional regulator with GAF, ATPase, and Fis domain
MLLEHGSFLGRQIASKSPVQIPDIATTSAGDANLMALVEAGFRTVLLVPMIRNDELVGSFSIGWRRIEDFTENEIELVTDFAAQAAIALEITRRERQLRELQISKLRVRVGRTARQTIIALMGRTMLWSWRTLTVSQRSGILPPRLPLRSTSRLQRRATISLRPLTS